MLKYSEERALSLFLSDYVRNYYGVDRTFKEICIDVEAEDQDMVTVWGGIACVRGYDISTLIHEVEEALREAMKIKG